MTPKPAKPKAAPAKPKPKPAPTRANAKTAAVGSRPKSSGPKPEARSPRATPAKPEARSPRPTPKAAPSPPPSPPPLAGIPSPPALRAHLLVDGARFGAATLTRHPLPALRLTAGPLVACDPLEVAGPVFARRLRRGTFGVGAVVATYPGKHGPGEQVLAAVVLEVAAAAPVAWAPATFADDPAAVDPGYRTDSGAGCFMDLHLQAALAAEASTFPTPSYRALERQLLDEHHTPTWGWAVYPEPPTNAGCVAYLGRSSPTRRSYWGLDAAGAVVCLLTDLETFPADVWTELAPLV